MKDEKLKVQQQWATETFSSGNLGCCSGRPRYKEPSSSDSFAHSWIGSSDKLELEKKFELRVMFR